MFQNSPARSTCIAAVALFAAGLAAALAPDADAARSRKKKKKQRRARSQLIVQSVNVARSSGVAGNEIIEMVFSSDVDPSSVNHAVIRIRGENERQTGFTRAAFGTFEVSGHIVRFFPRLPTHLRDPGDPAGGFHPEGSEKDAASENAGLQPSTTYELTILGSDSFSPLRSKRGRPLKNSFTTRFATASRTDPGELYTTRTYADSPPPSIAFSNPPDRPASASDQYARAGGTQSVQNDLSISLFATKVPLAPQRLRTVGNVELVLTSRGGDSSVRRVVDGSVFVEQNFATTNVVFKPRFPLADRGTYVLRMKKDVKDITEQFDLQPNRERARLRAIYDWLSAARAQNPGVLPEDLQDPPSELIPDWPAANDPEARGLLKRNLLALGDTRPDEIDPRAMLVFSTRDEPVTDAHLDLHFVRADDLFDHALSTGDYDTTVPGAASGIMTVAGGSARDGDFLPTADTRIDMDAFPGRVANFRDVVIPPGVTVTVEGSGPVEIRAINFTLEGTLDAGGRPGESASTGTRQSGFPPLAQRRGGAGGPGGGAGGNSGTYYYHPTQTRTGTTTSGSPYTVGSNSALAVGGAGKAGLGTDLGVADPDDGGRGGLGGKMGNGNSYNFGGGGGGGGHRTAGQSGANTTSATTSWNGAGGAGGAGADNEDLVPLVGGSGGGSGGNSTWGNGTWNKTAGAGGGGGGALLIQTARELTIGTAGLLRADGGAGGNGTGTNGTLNAGPGGGGSGGSLLLRSTAAFDLADPASAVSARGGAGGTQNAGGLASPSGGAGGDGYVRLEDPSGGLAVPGGLQGTFDPVGGGVPSVVYTHFADLGADGPRILEFARQEVGTNPTSNDAILVEMQMTREHPSVFGDPDLSAIGEDGESADSTITSAWLPVKIHDNTGIPGGAFDVDGWNPAVHGPEHVFPVAEVNGMSYRFVRFRISFQLDDLHARTDPLPFVDQIRMRFQFNF